MEYFKVSKVGDNVVDDKYGEGKIFDRCNDIIAVEFKGGMKITYNLNGEFSNTTEKQRLFYRV